MEHENVFLFVPNLIGYLRVALAIWSFYLLPTWPWYAMGLYGLSCILDAADGSIARQLNQATKFGAVLDMVTDRCTTACLMLTLTHLLPAYTLAFQILLSLDISSHYMHMYASMMSGASSHKSISKDANTLLRLYYSNQHVLFLVCAGNELFFMTTYLLAPHDDVYSPVEADSLARHGDAVRWLWWCSFPIFVFKQVTNAIQLVNAAVTLSESDTLARRKGKEKARNT
ncbi:CDP-diacylglycerol---inositol 3-phosphatidyltransferase [Synchytrium endobioticum]|uniref:CDP-diacylglycerol--inositol 3-phosphatidyltransferase n=1 Tax=Synchytrium endobioticum TaxID=286115 RepID=A0A507CZI0_9FUNG|nr:CDP-diacylglycerol---inositol 3-phosphatidyltransferase [Synchytrium endobioticum]